MASGRKGLLALLMGYLVWLEKERGFRGTIYSSPSPHILSFPPEALEHCGGIDFLVCMAGVSPFVGSALTLGADEQVWDKARPGVGSYRSCVALWPPFVHVHMCTRAQTHTHTHSA